MRLLGVETKEMGMITALALRNMLVLVAAMSAGMGITILMTGAFGLLSYVLFASFMLGAVICYGYSCFLGELQRREANC